MSPPRQFLRPLAAGAPAPFERVPTVPSRMLHFFDPSNAKMAAKLPDLAARVDVLVGNLEDGVTAANKETARTELVRLTREIPREKTQLWTRVNGIDSPWGLDDLLTLVPEIGDVLDVVVLPMVRGPEDIHYADRLLAQLESRANLDQPILVHAVLETPSAVARVEETAACSPRLQGMSLGPADLAASRRMKTTRVGGGHPGYLVREDPANGDIHSQRRTAQQDLLHYTLARMVDACTANEIFPYYGPFGDIADTVACEHQFRNAFLLGCVGAWSLHPAQIDIARRVFTPTAEEVAWARRVIGEMGDGTGAVMVDGTMQDDASVKQCQVIVDLATELERRDPELATIYARETENS
jgi:malyl-CoA/(S)-citramalyl-CoA lyase